MNNPAKCEDDAIANDGAIKAMAEKAKKQYKTLIKMEPFGLDIESVQRKLDGLK